MKKILIVDDEKLLAEALAEKLTSAGYSCLIATDGQEALSSALNSLPDLILLDLVMPDISGYEVLQKLKANPSTSQIPVIILTNSQEEKNLNQAFDKGADAYLLKVDNSLATLVETINSRLSNQPNSTNE